jgi:hypothetical protein
LIDENLNIAVSFAFGDWLFQSIKSQQKSWQNKCSARSRHPRPRILPGCPLNKKMNYELIR